MCITNLINRLDSQQTRHEQYIDSMLEKKEKKEKKCKSIIKMKEREDIKR